MSKEVKSFGDLGLNFDDIDEWVKFEELLDETITVEDYIIAKGTKGDYAVIKFSMGKDEGLKGTTTGGKVVLEKLAIAKSRELLPLPGKVVKIKEWYDLR